MEYGKRRGKKEQLKGLEKIYLENQGSKSNYSQSR